MPDTKPIVHTRLIRDFLAARRASVPIVAIETSDPAAVMIAITTAINGTTPIVMWDSVRGLMAGPGNRKGEQAIASSGIAQAMTVNPVYALMAADKFPEGTILFMLNGSRALADGAAVQGVWNLRDLYKLNQRTLVLLATHWTLPAELKHDIIVLVDPLPGREELMPILIQQFQNADVAKPADETIERSLDAVQGLSAFEAEQTAAMSMTKDGLAIERIWERKCQAIASAADGGLRIERVVEGFEAMGGCESVIKFGKQLIASRWFSTVWFIDEIEKDLAGMHTDTSGVTQYQHKAILTFTQRYRIPALLLIGQPGSGKTLFARSIAGSAGVPLAEMNLGALKGSHVGDTEQNTQRALETLTAISQGRLLLVATCNDVGTLERSPELLRRFKLPKFYFDLLTAPERAIVWHISGTRHGVEVNDRPDDTDWTGAEIDACCETAGRLGLTVLESAEWIVPMAVASAMLVEQRRTKADGNYLSASYSGVYRRSGPVVTVHPQRKIAVERCDETRRST